jgi:WD repeat-containing protein 89
VPFEGKQKALLSCDVSLDGLTVAAGTELQQDDALILYWCVYPFFSQPIVLSPSIWDLLNRDPRNPAAPLRKHTSTHSDDITTVRFFRSTEEERSHNNNLLLSGSTDGLVCISNANEADEDEAVLHISNLGSSISQVGWIPSRRCAARRTPTAGDRDGVWAATDMETFYLLSDEARISSFFYLLKQTHPLFF